MVKAKHSNNNTVCFVKHLRLHERLSNEALERWKGKALHQNLQLTVKFHLLADLDKSAILVRVDFQLGAQPCRKGWYWSGRVNSEVECDEVTGHHVCVKSVVSWILIVTKISKSLKSFLRHAGPFSNFWNFSVMVESFACPLVFLRDECLLFSVKPVTHPSSASFKPA